MIKNLTDKQWFIIYGTGIFLSMILVFQIAVKPTLELKRSYQEKKIMLESLSTAPQEIKIISEKLNTIDQNLNTKSSLLQDTRDDLLEAISNYCIKNNIKVFSYPKLHLHKNKSFRIESNTIILKGDFKNLLKLIYHMETNVSFSRIASLRYYTELNRKTKREELYLEMIFQNIKDYDKK